jgi:hypothetical protein
MGGIGEFFFGSPSEPGKVYPAEVYRPPYTGAGEDLSYRLIGELFGMPAYNPQPTGKPTGASLGGINIGNTGGGGKPGSSGGGGGKPDSSSGGGKPGSQVGQGRSQPAISAMPSFFSPDYESGQYDLLRDAMEKSLKIGERDLAETMNRAGVYGAGPHAQNLREMLQEAQKQYGNQATQISIATALQRFQEDMARRQMALQWASGQRPQQVTAGFGVPGSPGSTGLFGEVLKGGAAGAATALF